jgi:PleD family two-component response regulator
VTEASDSAVNSKGKLLIIADLYFFAKLREGAISLGYEATGAGNMDIARKKLAEDKFVAVLLSFNKDGFDWEECLTHVRSRAETRELPILTFGSHVDTGAFKRAKEVGADMVVPNSQIASDLPYVLASLFEY